jgi:hypothetical protein
MSSLNSVFTCRIESSTILVLPRVRYVARIRLGRLSSACSGTQSRNSVLDLRDRWPDTHGNVGKIGFEVVGHQAVLTSHVEKVALLHTLFVSQAFSQPSIQKDSEGLHLPHSVPFFVLNLHSIETTLYPAFQIEYIKRLHLPSFDTLLSIQDCHELCRAIKLLL